MNCRHISKFMCNKVNLKSISTQPPAKVERIFNSLQRKSKGQPKSLKFVSTVKAPKISAESYHDSAQQARISKRILFLQNAQTSGTVGAKLVTTRLQNLMQLGPPSLMNFSTKNIVKSRSVKSISKHKTGSRLGSASSSRSSFIRKSNSFLSKFMASNAESAQKRYESTGTWTAMPPSRQDRGERGMKMRAEKRAEISPHRDESVQMDQMSAFTSGRNDVFNRSKERREDMRADRREDRREERRGDRREDRDEDASATEPLTLSFNIQDRLDEVSSRIRDDLMKIDGSLKEKLHLLRNKVHKGIAQTGQKDEPRIASSEEATDQTDTTHLDLMPVAGRRGVLSAYITDYSPNQRQPILGKYSNPANMVRIRRDMVMVDQPGDGRPHNYRLIEPLEVRDNLMDIPSIRQRRQEKTLEPLRPREDRTQHVIEIRTRDAADADGVYFAPRRSRRLYSS